jgi:cobalt-precorrin 5A hydrolase
MVGDQSMSRSIAIGVGCRLGCDAPAIERVIRLALDRVLDGAAVGLFTVADKRGEAGLAEAADILGLPLVLLTRAALRDQVSSVETDSPASRRRFGVPSVAEAAALAGAGPGAVLLVPRIALAGATCAIAGVAEAMTRPGDPSRCVRRKMARSGPDHHVRIARRAKAATKPLRPLLGSPRAPAQTPKTVQ